MTGRHTRKAFTLAELLVSMSITAVIGLAVSTLAFALSYAHDKSEPATQAVTSGRNAMFRLEAAFRKAKLVLAVEDGKVALWTGDHNGDGKINPDELSHVEFHPDTGQLISRRVVLPESLTEGEQEMLNANKLLADMSNTDQVRSTISKAAYDPYRLETVLAADVTGFSIVPDAAPPMTRLARISLALGPSERSITLTSSVRLRADAVGQVSLDGGNFVLDAE